MNKLIFLMIAVFLLSTYNADAQLDLGKLKNKVKDAVNNEKSSGTSSSSHSSSGESTEKKITKAFEDPYEPHKDNGKSTDAIHANHLKEIVFSSTPIESTIKSFNIQGNATEAMLAKSFSLTDDIYMMAYFENSFYNQMMKDKTALPENTYYTPRIWFEVDGKMSGKKGSNKFEKSMGKYDFLEWTNLSFPKYSLTKFETFSQENPQLAFYSYVLPLLQTGENKVKVFVAFDVIKYNGNGGPEATMSEEERTVYSPAEPMATGEFTLNVKNIEEVKTLLVKSNFIPQAAQKNPALENQIMKVYNTGNTEDQAVKVIITDSDWTISRDDFGIILGRYVDAKVVVTSTDPDSYIIWDKKIEQPYAGGGQYSTKIVLSNYTTPSYSIAKSLID
jgi:hypothetical protein